MKKKMLFVMATIVAFALFVPSVWATETSDPKVYTSGENSLTLEGDFQASGYDAAIYVHSGAKLTINGEGNVHAFADNAGSGVKYSTTIWANGQGSEIIINGGTYTNEGVEGDDHFDLVYAKDGGKIIINGGTFKCVTPKWTLNLHDSKVGEIIVKGGTFYKFNPAEAETEPGEGTYNFVAPGYRVVQDGDWYTVYEIKEPQAEVSNNVDNSLEVEKIVLDSLKDAIEDNSELAEAIEGKSIEVEVQVRPIEVTESEKETIEKETAKINKTIKIAEYIDISIVVKDADTEEEITKLSNVNETIKFSLEIPSELKNDIPEGYTRVFYIVRNHDGIIDVLEVTEDEGKLFFESDKFSTYALAYEDKIIEDETKEEDKIVEEEKKEDNPKTGDINLAFLIGTILIGAAGAVIVSKKRFAKSN